MNWSSRDLLSVEPPDGWRLIGVILLLQLTATAASINQGDVHSTRLTGSFVLVSPDSDVASDAREHLFCDDHPAEHLFTQLLEQVATIFCPSGYTTVTALCAAPCSCDDTLIGSKRTRSVNSFHCRALTPASRPRMSTRANSQEVMQLQQGAA
eukprot:6001905-Prymnesium_polylepis.1